MNGGQVAPKLYSKSLPTSKHTHTQADVNGLKWIRYLGPNSTMLEAPKDDPVLNSYARLLSEG